MQAGRVYERLVECINEAKAVEVMLRERVQLYLLF